MSIYPLLIRGTVEIKSPEFKSALILPDRFKAANLSHKLISYGE